VVNSEVVNSEVECAVKGAVKGAAVENSVAEEERTTAVAVVDSALRRRAQPSQLNSNNNR